MEGGWREEVGKDMEEKLGSVQLTLFLSYQSEEDVGSQKGGEEEEEEEERRRRGGGGGGEEEERRRRGGGEERGWREGWKETKYSIQHRAQMIHQTAKTQRERHGEGWRRMEKDGETGNEFTVPQCCYGYLLKGKGCGPGLSDGKVSPQGGSVRAGVRLCGVGRVMVSDRCWFSVRVRI